MQTEVVCAGFWIRVVATLIDCFLITILTMPFIISIYGWSYYTSDDPAPYYYLFYGFEDAVISYVIPAIICIWFWFTFQATPGKMLVGIRIMDATTGKAPTLNQHVVRYFGYIVSTIIFCLGHIWVAFDTKKQGWHDKMAGTVVIYTRNNHQIH